jgi:hypothetical protein
VSNALYYALWIVLLLAIVTLHIKRSAMSVRSARQPLTAEGIESYVKTACLRLRLQVSRLAAMCVADVELYALGVKSWHPHCRAAALAAAGMTAQLDAAKAELSGLRDTKMLRGDADSIR